MNLQQRKCGTREDMERERGDEVREKMETFDDTLILQRHAPHATRQQKSPSLMCAQRSMDLYVPAIMRMRGKRKHRVCKSVWIGIHMLKFCYVPCKSYTKTQDVATVNLTTQSNATSVKNT